MSRVRGRLQHMQTGIIVWFIFINVVGYLVMSDDKKEPSAGRTAHRNERCSCLPLSAERWVYGSRCTAKGTKPNIPVS